MSTSLDVMFVCVCFGMAGLQQQRVPKDVLAEECRRDEWQWIVSLRWSKRLRSSHCPSGCVATLMLMTMMTMTMMATPLESAQKFPPKFGEKSSFE